MSISEKKRLSEKKELFLAICLISGEISSETIRRMKADFGDTQIKNNVIQSLRKDGYIKRVNRKNAGYGYQLTSSGLAYMKIKFPERYEYDLFSESKAYAYDENVRYRNTTLSAILYYLSRSGVELTNHAETMRKLFRGEHINVDAPFFITTKQMKMINRRFIPVYGYRIFGWIITQYAIYAVYFSDSQHPIHLSHEENVHVSLSITLQYAQSPYSVPHNYRFLFLFENEDDFINSFVGYRREETKNKFTASMYQEYRYKNTSACIMSNPDSFLPYILDNQIADKINESFEDIFDLTCTRVTNFFYNFRFFYNDDIRTAICWTLSPTTIIEAFDLCNPDVIGEDEVGFLCFEESVDILKRLFKRHRASDLIKFGQLSKEEAMPLLKDKNKE